MSGIPFWASLHRCSLVALAIVVCALPAAALSQGQGDRPDKDDEVDTGERSGKEREALDRYRESEERRRAKRETKEAKEERKRSRTRYRDRSKREAIEIARAEQPALIDTGPHEPLALEAGEELEELVGDFGARIEGPEGTQVVDSSLPLRSGVGGGGKRLVDYSLEDRGATLAPDNPILETEIAEDVRGGLRVDDLGLSLQTPSSVRAEVVEDRAFFANALADSDLVVLPTATGAQISLQVRSADAPEQAVLALELPAGARARLVEEDGGSPDGELPPGSVEIVAESGEVLSTILAPLAWGADGDPLQASYELRDDELIVHYPHRSADVLYPLAVDPFVVDRFRIDESGTRISNGSFAMGLYGDRAAWYFTEDNGDLADGGFPHTPSSAGRYEYNAALLIQNRYNNSWYYRDTAYGQWIWQAPRQSFIARADFSDVYYRPTFQNHPRAMCFGEGVWSVTRFAWETGSYYDSRGHTGTSPFIGGPAPNGSCNSHNGVSKAHDLTTRSPGNVAVFKLFAYGEGAKENYSYAQMGGGAVFLDDWDNPAWTGASAPSTWLAGGLTVNHQISARDPGLGVNAFSIAVPRQGGGTNDQAWWVNSHNQTQGAACSSRISRCPEYASHTFQYSTSTMPEGQNTVNAYVIDPLYKQPTQGPIARTVKVDRSPPTGTISGISGGELARDRDYQITATSTDMLSGSRTVQITLDGAQKASRSNCPANANPCELNWTFDGGDPALTEGTHALRVIATDQVGNSATVATRYFDVERTPPEFELGGSLLPTDTGWVAKGDQDLIVDAFDEPSSVPATGATYIEARIDGTQVEPPVEQPCAAGGCELGAEFVKNTDGLAEGAHTLEVVVRDGAGNLAESDPIEFKLERSAPAEPVLAGTLWEARDQTLTPGVTYTLSAGSTDFEGTVMQSGLGAMDVVVDDDGADVQEQPCAMGGCPMTRSFSYTPEENEPGPHTFTVAATDLAGNESSTQFSVNNPEAPEPECQSPAATPASGSVIPSLNSDLALEAFRLRLPGAFQPWIARDFESRIIQPALDPSDPDFYTATGTIAEMSVDKDESDGATSEVWTDYVPICTTPTTVGPDPSEPKDVVDGTTTLSALYANSVPGVDTLIRPTPVGTSSLLQLRDPAAPSEFSWDVALQPGQELRELPGGAVGVIEPVPPDSEIITTGDAPPGIPSLEERRAALNDTVLYFEQSTGALLRALEEIPDEIVAVIPNPWAVDALDRPVETTLAASGSTVTMRVVKQDLEPTAYPVIAAHEVVVGDSLDEWEVLESEEETADEPGDASAAPPITDDEPTAPPVDIYPDDPADDFVDADPSATDDSDLDDDVDSQDGVQFAEPSAAGAKRPPVKGDIGLSETAPAVLYNPRRVNLGSRYHRPIIPWRVTNIIDRYKRRDPTDPGDTPAERKRRERFTAEEKRAFKWDSQAPDGTRKGWFNIATAPELGVKAPGEDTVTTDIGLQFVRAKIDGKVDVTDVRPPRLAQYKTTLRRFLKRYGSVMEDQTGERVGTLTPWNEPNYSQNPTFKKPVIAARYWKAAQAICHPKDANNRCGEVVAGEWAGFPNPKGAGLVKHKGRVRSYERVYEQYILHRSPDKGKQRPRAWGWHNYGDTFAYQRMGKFAPRRRFNWKITSRFYRKYSSGAYNYVSNGTGRFPKRWLTATGVFYHRNCGERGKPFFDRQCSADAENNDKREREVVLFNMRNQSNTLNAMFRKIARDLDSIGRIYYYDLQDVANASTYSEAPEAKRVRGRGAGPYDTGLIGSDDDGGDPRYENRAKVRHYPDGKKAPARLYSDKNEPRLAFCSFKRKLQAVNRPRSCTP